MSKPHRRARPDSRETPTRDFSSGALPVTTRRLRVAMALYGDVTYDSRVLREADTLARAGHDVVIHSLAGSAPSGSPFRVVVWTPNRSAILPGRRALSTSARAPGRPARIAAQVRWLLGYARNIRAWGRWAVAMAGEVDVWHAHDLTALLAVGRLVRPPVRLVYDSHEIFMDAGSAAGLPTVLRRLLAAYEGHLARRAYALVTVNEAYASVLERRLRPRRAVIVRNCPPRSPLSTTPAGLRAAAGIAPSSPLILYHGAFTRHRGMEQLVEAMLRPGLEDAHLALLGLGDLQPALETLAADPRFDGRIHVVDAVRPQELLGWVAEADVDVMPLQRSTLNHYLCTPNKLWESLAAGVPVVVSDFPVMRRVVLENPDGPLGRACDPRDPGSIAEAIREVIEFAPTERARLRARCLRAAHERWNWETESSRLVGLYAELAAT